MIDIPEAADMYKISEENDSEERLSDRQLKRIVRKIKKRANKGYYFAKILWPLHSTLTEVRLKNSGYRIDTSLGRDYWLVSWLRAGTK